MEAKHKGLLYDLRKNRVVYLMALPMVVFFFVFCYVPMYGVLISFQDYNLIRGVLGSKWVGFKYFLEYFQSPYFFRTVRNTFLLSFYSLLWGFPAPILLALMINEVKTSWFKRVVQTMTYMTYFLSAVVICGIIRRFVAGDGLINDIVVMFGGARQNLIGQVNMFRTIYVASGIWTGIGWGSIIYLSALTAIDPELYDSASIDGCGRIRKMWHISLPGIANTVVIMLILACGGLLSVGFEKVLLLYSEGTFEVADVISTYVYRRGIEGGAFSFSTAVGLFNSAVNLVLLVSVNWLARKYSDYSLW